MAKSVKIDSSGYYLDADEPTMTAEEEMKDREDVKVVPTDAMTVKDVVGKYWAVAIKLLELVSDDFDKIFRTNLFDMIIILTMIINLEIK